MFRKGMANLVGSKSWLQARYCGHVSQARRYLLEVVGVGHITPESFSRPSAFIGDVGPLRPFSDEGFGVYKGDGVYHFPSISQEAIPLQPTEAAKATTRERLRLSAVGGPRVLLPHLAPGALSAILATNRDSSFAPRRETRGAVVGTKLCNCPPEGIRHVGLMPLENEQTQVRCILLDSISIALAVMFFASSSYTSLLFVPKPPPRSY